MAKKKKPALSKDINTLKENLDLLKSKKRLLSKDLTATPEISKEIIMQPKSMQPEFVKSVMEKQAIPMEDIPVETEVVPTEEIAIKKQPNNVPEVNNVPTIEKAANVVEDVSEAEKQLPLFKKELPPEIIEPSTTITKSDFEALQKAKEQKKAVRPIRNKIGQFNEEFIQTFGRNQPEIGAAIKEPVVANVAEDLSKYKSVSPVYENRLQELIKDFENLPQSIKEKLTKIAPEIEGMGTKIARFAAPIGAGLSYVDAVKSSQELANQFPDLNLKQKLGKGLKAVGGAGMTGATLAELGSMGAATPLAAPVGLGSLGLYGLGEYLDEPVAPKQVKPGPISKTQFPYTNLFEASGLNKLSDEDIQNKLQEYNQNNRSPDSLKNIPSKGEIVNYAIERAKNYGLNPAQALGILEQESGFNVNAVSKTGARGLGQMFPGAFADAQQEDKEGILKDADYDEVHSDPSQWKKQIDASLLYQKAIQNRYNKSGTFDEGLLRYVGGPSASKEDILKRGTNPDKYINNVKNLANKWEEILGDEDLKKQKFAELGRSPASYIPTEKEKPVLDYLSGEQDLGKVLNFGPYSNANLYGKALADQSRLMELKESVPTAPVLADETQEEPTDESEKEGLSDIEKFVQAQKGSTLNTVEKLKELQDKANQFRLFDIISQGTERIGRGISGAMSGIKVEAAEMPKYGTELAENFERQFDALTKKEADDPSSQYSTSIKSFAKPVLERMGVKPELIEGMSGTQIHKILPQITDMYEAKVRSDYMKGMVETKKEQKEEIEANKRFAKMGNDIIAEKASSRSTFGTDSRTLAATQNIRALFEGRDLNDLDNREVYEVAKSLDRVLSQTGATISGTEKLTPATARGFAAKAIEYVFNRRTGAGAESFLNQFEKNLNREEITAEKRIRGVQKRILAPYKDLMEKDPQKWNLIMQQTNLPNNPFVEETPKQTSEDAELQQIANQYFKGNLEAAKAYYRKKGQLQ